MENTDRPHPPRQADIARRAGVSQTTVSMVLNGRTEANGISDETRRRVLDAVLEAGYVANPKSRSLQGNRNRLLGVHTFEPVFPVTARDVYHDYLLGIEEQAVEEGYDLVLFATRQGSNGTRKVYGDGANRLNIADGSVMLGIDPDSKDLARLAAEGYAFVHLGRRDVPGHSIAYASADYTGATADIVTRLRKLGHQSVAYIARTMRVEPAVVDRRAGYAAGCSVAGVAIHQVDTLDPEDPHTDWLHNLRADGVTAVLVESVELARALVELATADGVRIPDDMSLVVLTDRVQGREEILRWSTLGTPRHAMGRMGVRILVEMLTNDRADVARQVLLPCAAPDDYTIAPPGGHR